MCRCADCKTARYGTYRERLQRRKLVKSGNDYFLEPVRNSFTQELLDYVKTARPDSFERRMAMRLLALQNGAQWDDTPHDRSGV